KNRDKKSDFQPTSQVTAMQELNMGSQPKLSTEPRTHALPKKPLTPNEKLEARIRLLHALQISQQPDQLLQNFFNHVQPLVSVTSMRFKFHEQEPDARYGK